MAEPSHLDEVARAAVDLLRALGLTVATAESLTGGMIGAAVTSVPGASAVYRGGVVAYATDLKQTLLGVDAGLLARVGAVDAQVAVQMASGVRERLGADYGVAVTGVAGPEPQDDQPPGTVWLGIAGPDRTWQVDVSSRGDRHEIRAATTVQALVRLVAVLSPSPEDRGRPGR